jgi:streptogramin lyase
MASHAQAHRVVALSILSAAGAAQADPLAFVVNAGSNSLSVVDGARELTRENLAVWDGSSPNATREPKDAIYDARSGRVFVASRARLVGFDGRIADGRGRSETPARDEGSSLALDEPGGRLFMSHEQVSPDDPNGAVSEFSLTNLAQPTLVAEHPVPGAPDLRFIAWDAKYRRVCVVDDDGAVARTEKGDLLFAVVPGASAPNPGGILADPNGGVWVSSRMPGKLVRVTEAGAVSEHLLPNLKQQPRGLAWKTGQILVAVEELDRVRRFNPTNLTWADEMPTGDRPQDVAVTRAGQTVSANRQTLDGSVSVAVHGGERRLLGSARDVGGDLPVPAALHGVGTERATAGPFRGLRGRVLARSGEHREHEWRLQHVDRAPGTAAPEPVPAAAEAAAAALAGADRRSLSSGRKKMRRP